MRWLGYVLLACLALAVLRAAIAALALVILVLIVWGLVTRPAATAAGLALAALFALGQQYPVVVLAAVVLLIGRSAARRSGMGEEGDGEHGLLERESAESADNDPLDASPS